MRKKHNDNISKLTTPKMPTPEPIAVSVGIISNFLAYKKNKRILRTFLVHEVDRLGVQTQWEVQTWNLPLS